MKYLKLVLPIVLLFILSCDPITGPDESKEEEEDNDKGYEVTLNIEKPEDNSVFDQKKEIIPCKTETSPDTVTVSWSLRWSNNIHGLDCEKGKIAQYNYNDLDNGKYKLQASVRHDNGDYTKDSVMIKFHPKPDVEITLPKMQDLRMAGSLDFLADRFMYAQNTNMWLKAKAKDSEGNKFTGSIEWIINGDVMATSNSGKGASIKAKPSYGKDSNVIAKVTNSDGLSWTDTLRFGVDQKLVLMSGKHGQNYKNWNTVIASHNSSINTIFNKNGVGHESIRVAPSLSHDGKKATFTTGETNGLGKENLFISNYDFSNPKKINVPEKLGLISLPRFSPSGDKIAFTSFEGLPDQMFYSSYVYLYDIESKTTSKIKTGCEQQGSYPCWADLYHDILGDTGRLAFTPDGHIVTSVYELLSDDEARVAIIKINPNSGDYKFIWKDKLVSNPESIKPQVYDISPNGKWISLTAKKSSSNANEIRKRIAVLKTDGSMDSPRFITPKVDDWTQAPDWPIFIDNNTVSHTKNDGKAGSVEFKDLEGNIIGDKTVWTYRIKHLSPYPH